MAVTLFSPHKRLPNHVFFSSIGFFIWLIATLMFRLYGHVFFLVNQPLILFISFILPIPLILMLACWLYEWRNLSMNTRPTAALYLVLPGMFLDVLCLLLYSTVFPNLPLGIHHVLGGWLLWCYSIAILSGIINLSRHSRQRDHVFFTLVGFGIGIGGTIFYRFVGHTFFLPSLLMVNYLLSVFMAIAFTYPLYWLRATLHAQRPEAAIYVLTPIISINALSSTFYADIYPNLPISMSGVYSSVFMLAYAFGLLTGMFPRSTRMEQ